MSNNPTIGELLIMLKVEGLTLNTCICGRLPMLELWKDDKFLTHWVLAYRNKKTEYRFNDQSETTKKLLKKLSHD